MCAFSGFGDLDRSSRKQRSQRGKDPPNGRVGRFARRRHHHKGHVAQLSLKLPLLAHAQKRGADLPQPPSPPLFFSFSHFRLSSLFVQRLKTKKMMMPDAKSRAQTLKNMVSSGLSFLRRGFNPSKCKTEAKLATARIKLLRNRREAQVRQMRRDLAMLLESGRDDTARIRVEHVIREQNTLAANEIIDLFCELIVARLPIITKQRECPADLKEGISSLIYASPRCSEIPELNRIRRIFEKKYGEDFVSAATDLRPDSGVNQLLIEKLSVRKPSGEVKLKILKEIAKEYQVPWDPTETEQELLKPPEEPLEGPRNFVSATSFPLKPTANLHDAQEDFSGLRHSNDREILSSRFKDSAAAAKAAADSAEEAISAAKAAAYLANKKSDSFHQSANLDPLAYSYKSSRSEWSQGNSSRSDQPYKAQSPSDAQMKPPGKVLNSQSFNEFRDEDVDSAHSDNLKILRAPSCLVRTVHSDIKFDNSEELESDADEEPEVQWPAQTSPPPGLPSKLNHAAERSHLDSYPETFKGNLSSRVHPKLPDYEELTSRFESLRSSRSST